jgi:hypothetical protein
MTNTSEAAETVLAQTRGLGTPIFFQPACLGRNELFKLMFPHLSPSLFEEKQCHTHNPAHKEL